MPGFGAGSSSQGIAYRRQPGEPVERMADSLEALSRQIAGPIQYRATPFNLASGAFTKLDLSNTEVNGFIISVNTGAVNVWLGDFTGINGAVPQFQFAFGASQQFD